MKNYIVIRKGCCLKGTTESKIGDRVKLTDEKAISMSGKVQLLKDYELVGKSEQELIQENAKLLKQIEDLTAELDEATKPAKKSCKKAD